MSKTITTAVIMAAGMGTRLKERGTQHPKGFLKLGDKPIIEESIQRLQAVGIKRIIIITGHLSDYYLQLSEQYSGLIETIHNDVYADSGSMYSLYCAQQLIDSDFLLLESDLIYERLALETCITYAKDNVVLLSGTTHSGDEVYVETQQDKLIAMSKKREQLGENIAGELVGISKVSLPLYKIMCQLAKVYFETSKHMDYETQALVQAAQQYPVYTHVVSDLIWSEIDDESHLNRALLSVYPSLLNKDG